MIRAMTRATTLAGLALAVGAAAASAQGSISAQGFGYPAGGLSTRAAASGGAFGEFDFASPRNPSSLLGWGRGGLYAQYDPEFRSLSAPGRSESATLARFPLFMAATQLGQRGIAALSFSTLLDRTWATRVRGEQVLGPDTVGYEETVQSIGALNDLRLAFGYSVSSAVSFGAGIHGVTGENRMILVRQFDDTLRYGSLLRQLTLGYLGTGVSFGATWRPSRFLAVAASARTGGNLDLRIADTLVARAKVPGRLGLAVRYDGLPGASVAFSAERTSWSRMKPLSETSLVAHDAWEYGAGAELTGPRLRGVPALFSLGYRRRDLPFSLTSRQLTEHIYAAGVGLPLAGPSAIVDFGIQRASRGSVSGVQERAWIFSVGLTVRP
jgi:hypothetical protein